MVRASASVAVSPMRSANSDRLMVLDTVMVVSLFSRVWQVLESQVGAVGVCLVVIMSNIKMGVVLLLGLIRSS